MAKEQNVYKKIWNDNNPNDQIVSGDGCCIHHINGDHFDHRIENLQKMKGGEHTSLHMTGENHPFYGVKGKDNPHYRKIVGTETREKLRIASTGKVYSEESKKKMSDSHKGKIPVNKGVPMSEEQKIKLSKKLKGRPGCMKGKTHSDEAKSKISKANKGKKRTEEAKRNMRKAWERRKNAS